MSCLGLKVCPSVVVLGLFALQRACCSVAGLALLKSTENGEGDVVTEKHFAFCMW
jgi:hypothetical protein